MLYHLVNADLFIVVTVFYFCSLIFSFLLSSLIICVIPTSLFLMSIGMGFFNFSIPLLLFSLNFLLRSEFVVMLGKSVFVLRSYETVVCFFNDFRGTFLLSSYDLSSLVNMDTYEIRSLSYFVFVV